MKKILLAFLLFISTYSISQTYQPNWESLDKRPTPSWFKDSKFGIFIHWGVYSVPGWCTKGNYAEWYQQGLQTTDSARMKFHKAKFGDRTYYDLANDFKAELFNPDEWAKLFERSGAKYIVLTSKHHDGFTLWPDKIANQTWGFPWNAMDIGPKRDLLGDLFRAVRKTSVHAGMYYSLYEWFNPLWKKDPVKYAAEHVWPQMKELINNYQPDVFWTDGDWEAPPETWKSQEFLAWLFNESVVKNKVVVNDRWGSTVRFNHGGIYTPEYQPGLDFEDHDWEESRGMGYSYGYNREEDAWDYNSAQSLVIALVDKVSRGGNFLLDIGPDEHGKIPPIMQERLLQMGDWLKINGEAIYNTRKWKSASQWSNGNRDYHTKPGEDVMLKLTVDPDPGYAVKEVFYTYNPTTNTLYAILPRYPDKRKIVLKGIDLSESNSKVSLLDTGQGLSWSLNEDSTIVELPEYDPNKMKAPFAFVIRVSNYGKFAKKPGINVTYDDKGLQPFISLTAEENSTIRFTTDGSEPALNSEVYTKPFTVKNTSMIWAKAFQEGSLPSSTAEQKVIKYEWMNSVKVSKPQQGIAFKYYEPSGKIDMNSLQGAPVNSGFAGMISVLKKQRPDKFAFEFSGYIKILNDGVYTFFTESDDGSKLMIDDHEVVDNDGDHGNQERNGKAALMKGFHRIRVLYFDSGGGNFLKVSMQAEVGLKNEISSAILFH